MGRPGDDVLTTTVTLEIEDGLATARLARAHGNAINGALVDDLTRVVNEVRSDDGTRGMMLAASGRLFCPGLDLQELIELDRGEMEAFVVRFTECVAALYAFPKPLVAAMQGHAVAGGCVLSLTADWRVLAHGALVGLNEVRVGVPLPFGVSLILRETVPRLFLEEVALLGKNYRDREALAAGLAHEIRPLEGFEDHCRGKLAEFASRDPLALATTKTYLRSAIVERIRAHERDHLQEFLDAWFQPSTRSRILEIVDDLRRRG